MKRQAKIMVADDDPAILDALTLLLEDEGYDVLQTVDAETVPKVKRTLPDILLLDIWMSGINGGDICRELKKEEKTSAIPVIMISANRDTEEIAKESGADDFLLKPFDIDDLLGKIEKYLKKN